MSGVLMSIRPVFIRKFIEKFVEEKQIHLYILYRQNIKGFVYVHILAPYLWHDVPSDI